VKLDDSLTVSGCVTKEKFIAGRSLAEIERIIGFHAGRLAKGAIVVALTELPELSQFDLAAYSIVATHRLTPPVGLDIEKLKTEAKKTWSLAGPERLVKLLPTIRHSSDINPDIQYPPGLGAPQWLLKVPIHARVSGIVEEYPNGRYVAA
jgi:hypothetical protein